MSRAIREVMGYDYYSLRIGIPAKHSGCQYCPVLSYDRDRDARYCKQTGEVLFNFKSRRGEMCPLLPEQQKED